CVLAYYVVYRALQTRVVCTCCHINRIIVLFSRRSKHILKIKNKQLKKVLRFGPCVTIDIYRISFSILVHQVSKDLYLYNNNKFNYTNKSLNKTLLSILTK